MKSMSELIVQADKEKDLEKKTEIFINIAVAYWQLSDLKNSEKYAQLTLNMAQNHHLQNLEAAALNTLGLIEVSSNNYDEALNYFLQTFDVYKAVSNNPAIAITLGNIGIIYLNMNKLDKALEYFLRAKNYVPQQEDYNATYNTESVIINTGITYLRMGKFDEALKNLEEAYSFCSKHKLKRSEAIILVNTGEAYMAQDQHERAIEYFTKAIYVARELEDKKILIPAMNNLGASFCNFGQYEKAVETHSRTLQMAEELGYKEFIKNIYLYLSQDYEKQGDFESALQYYKKHSEIKDSLFTEELTRKLADVTSSHEMERKELLSKQMMEKAGRLASIGVIAGGITHEINQPVCAIKMSAESILYWNRKNDLILPEYLVEGLENIVEASNRIDEIIKHMRSFWKLPETISLKPIDLNEAVKHALNLIERQLYSHEVFIETKLANQKLYICAESIHIEQIILNIITNAIHSLDDSKQKDKRIQICTRSKDNQVVLQISDNGTGINLEEGEKIYDPFYSTKSPDKGMGLGLAIVKNYVDKYNAEIKAGNRKTGGAEFVITFKKSKGAES
ncbi:MAG: tetratricopeptide repeat protein [Ignavibacteriales bacterium]|nr:tetratricopeptide repeat protein [Candidatus Cloacimonadota bacterium]MCF8307367.1 tetratricopeptide repeat protein [Ignavibacteriales bacterium]